MKNTTLLKVLSATAIFSAVAAIEAYDQDNFVFAADETPVVTNTTTTPTTNSSNNTKPTTTATPAANSTPAPATTPAATTPKADEPATVAQDVKALKDGEYKITAEAINFGNGKNPSMAAAGLDNEKTKLIVKNGQYSVNVTFKPIKLGAMSGYLGDLKYYDGDKNHSNRFEIKDNEFKDSTIVENYAENEKDAYIDTYKKKFPNRTVYPKTVTYNVDKNKIDDNNKLETFTEVFVPVMESIGEMTNNPGTGTQKMILKFDLSSLARKKVTADNYEAATYENPNKDVEYKGTIKKDFPIHVQGHLRNANNNDEESLYGSALDSYVKVEKVGDKYKYTLRFKKGLANVGGEFYPFELHKVAYQGKDIPLTTLASNGNSSVKEGSITTDKLLEKIQLDGTAPYPNGALMSHFVTLKLYYETASEYKDRPVKLEDVVAPAKPKPVTPAPAPVKPKEEPKPATPTAADHTVDAEKVPNTFPTTVKAELNGRTTGTASIYENAFVKDVKVEKVGDKYQYTIQVKEGKSTNFLLRNKPFTVSKLTYKGNEVNFTEVDAATKLKEGKILTDSLLDKIQVDAVLNVQTKGGAKPRFEERAAESTIALDFPTVEKVKEEAANNSVPAKIYDASVANKLSMSDGALVHEKTRVEKVNDTYHYYLTFKNLQFGPLVGTVDSLSVDGKAAERTDLGGEGNEKLFHFTSAEKLTEKTINFAVSSNGKPLHSNVPATLNFNWNAATPLTAEQVTALHQDEAAKVQAEAARLEKEKAEKEKAEAARLEKERLEKEAAAKAQAEKEKLEKEKAEAARLEKEKLEREKAEADKLAKEKAEREKAEAERLAKEKAEREKAEADRLAKEKAEREKAEAERLAKEKAEREKAEADRLAKEKAEADRLAKEKAEREKAEAERLAKEKAEKEKAEADRLAKEKAEREKAEADRLAKEKAEKEKAEADRLAKEKAEKEKAEADRLAKEKAEADRLEKERLEKEKAKLEELKKEALANIATDKDVNKKEAAKLKEIVNNASLKDTLVAKVVENGSSEKVTVTFDNTAIKADKLVVQKADKETAAKVEELVKKADENLSVVKTIDLHFESNNKIINKQGETRAVTVAVVANADEKLEVYYVNLEKEKLEKVPSAYKDGKLTFFTNHFSLYTIVKGRLSNSEKPSTSDTSSTSTNENTSSGTKKQKSSEVNSDKVPAQSGEQASLAKTGLSATATAGLGALLLLSALVLRRKSNK